MSTRCKPGDLAIITTGPESGKTVTVLSHASKEEVTLAASRALDQAVAMDDKHEKNFFWAIDRAKTWEMADGPVKKEFLMMYCPDNQLLPITPPASMHTKEQSKELSHG